MVRLRVLLGTFLFVGSFIFQFQYGAIKSAAPAPLTTTETSFQFQYGAIKRNDL